MKKKKKDKSRVLHHYLHFIHFILFYLSIYFLFYLSFFLSNLFDLILIFSLLFLLPSYLFLFYLVLHFGNPICWNRVIEIKWIDRLLPLRRFWDVNCSALLRFIYPHHFFTMWKLKVPLIVTSPKDVKCVLCIWSPLMRKVWVARRNGNSPKCLINFVYQSEGQLPFEVNAGNASVSLSTNMRACKVLPCTHWLLAVMVKCSPYVDWNTKELWASEEAFDPVDTTGSHQHLSWCRVQSKRFMRDLPW